ncbi:MAG TPA: SDR family oxidoreductase [Parvibaculum sp.]
MSEQKPVALLTDAAEFIGPAIVELFASKGVTVIAADPSFGDEEVAGALSRKFPNVIPIVQTTSADTAARAKAHREEIDILCAGGAHPATKTTAAGLQEEVTRSFFEKLAMEPLAYLSHLVEGMKARNYGRVVFVTSAAPLGGIPNYTAYASARAALNGAVKSLAMELASSGISVNAVAPNFVATEAYFPKALIEQPDIRKKILSRVPISRFGEPEEAAHAVEFFALTRSRFVTGQVMSVSGGWA